MFRILLTGMALTILVYMLLPGRSSPFEARSAEVRRMLELGQVSEAVQKIEARIAQNPQDLSARRELVTVMALQPSMSARPVIAREFQGELKEQELDHYWFYQLSDHLDPVVRANVATGIADAKLVTGYRTANRLAYDGVREVRIAATRALAQLQDERGRFTLLMALKDPDWQVRSTAAWGLGVLETDAHTVKSLFRVINDGDDYVRYRALKSLMAHVTPKNEGTYRRYLTGTEREKHAAILALAGMGAPDALPQLQQMLLGMEGKDRDLAARTLVRKAPQLSAEWLESADFQGKHTELRQLLADYLRRGETGATVDDIASGGWLDTL